MGMGCDRQSRFDHAAFDVRMASHILFQRSATLGASAHGRLRCCVVRNPHFITGPQNRLWMVSLNLASVTPLSIGRASALYRA
jgi:hypothetical protein